MSSFDYDYFVIGAGSGGVRSARIAAGHGAKVGIAEEWHLGGTCVNVGCVPKKFMVYAGGFSAAFEDAAGYGWTVGESRHDWKTLIANKNTEIQRLNGIYRKLLTNAGAEIFETRARLVDAHTIDLGDRTVTADKILIAVGGKPVLPDIPGAAEHAITSNDVFFLEEMPKRIAIVGGGYIALEFAGVFSRLGAETHLIHRRARLLGGFDEDIGL
ncbi:MAG: FAD-dependent oxidoreductase, partial [Pseudomonadota bacterium]